MIATFAASAEQLRSLSGAHRASAPQPMRHSQPVLDDTSIRRRLAAHIDALSQRHGPRALRISIGLVFLWFGVLKFFPTVSPAEEIAVQTLRSLTFNMISGHALLLGLAVFETGVGACFVLGVLRDVVLPLLVLHMLGTATPFLLFPAELFTHPFVPTFLGQYIAKNVIIVSAALVLRRRWH